MRVTNSMLMNTYRRNLNDNMDRIANIQAQMSNFEHSKFAHISDDPVSLIYSMQARSKLRQVADYQANVDTAQSWMTSVETGLKQMNEIVKNAMEQVTQGANDPFTTEEREKMGVYIGQLRDHMLSTLNMTMGDQYIYAGYNTTGYINADGKSVAPFNFELTDPTDPTSGVFTYNDDVFDGGPNSAENQGYARDVITMDVGMSAKMDLSFNGTQVAIYGYDNTTTPPTPKTLIGVLDDLYNELQNPNANNSTLNPYIKELQTAQEHVLSLTADIGGRTNRLDLLATRYESDVINYTEMMSNAEDADLAELELNFEMAKATYQAALSIGSYIIQPTLMDYLR